MGAFTLRQSEGGIVYGTYSLDSETNTLKFQPRTALKHETQYHAVLSGSVRTSSGASLGQDIEWSFSTQEPQPAVTSIVISGGDKALLVGDSIALTATVEVVAGADDTVFWSVGDPDIASVDEAGELHALAPGATTITATSVFDSSVSHEVNLIVADGPAVISVAVVPSSLYIKSGTTGQLTARVVTLGGLEGDVTWSSSDSTVATVLPDGRVYGGFEGTATVTATSTVDPSKRGTARIHVEPRFVLPPLPF